MCHFEPRTPEQKRILELFNSQVWQNVDLGFQLLETLCGYYIDLAFKFYIQNTEPKVIGTGDFTSIRWAYDLSIIIPFSDGNISTRRGTARKGFPRREYCVNVLKERCVEDFFDNLYVKYCGNED